MTFGRILVAVDPSPQGDAALALAIRLAADQRATLTVTTVVGRPGTYYAPPDVVVDPAIDEEFARDADQLLTRSTEAATAAGVAADTCRHEGDIVGAIMACIAEHNADLVVVGTHGRKGISRVLQGSVAEGVLRGTTIPVLVAHAHDKVRA
ncbi:MAG TPA: universal stress protein [Candidatus Elarobacter sp.]|jgi:nucleotide-binding universal stress UspA family protein